MNARLLNQTEAPLLLHLLALALWAGGALARTFLIGAVSRDRDWRVRSSLLGVLRRILLVAEAPGVLLGLGSGLWLVLSEHLYGLGSAQRLPIPVWLWVKIGLVAFGAVTTVLAFASLARARHAAETSVVAPTASLEDRFDAHRRGLAASGWLCLACLCGILVLSGVRPNW